MDIVKVNIRSTITNYNHESSVIYEEGYINLDRITEVAIMGKVARVKYSGIEGDYTEIDTKEWNSIYNHRINRQYSRRNLPSK